MALSDDDLLAVEQYFEKWWAWVRAAAAFGLHSPKWLALAPEVPLELIQRAALEHPNARVRRECLTVLDHEANDESIETFRAALADPVPRVRRLALHGLSCERCRTGELCATDVVPTLIHALQHDPSPRVRHDTVPILLRLSDRDERASAALETAAHQDDDPLVRQVALAAVQGRTRDIRSRKALRRRARVPAV